MAEETKLALKWYFERKLPGAKNVEIRNFKQPSAGWSDEAFIFDVHWESDGTGQQKGFAIRKQNKGGLMRENKNFFQQYKFLDCLNDQEDE